jgi:hypothetical protein
LALARILQAAARPYELASGNPLGSVMVGIPEEQFLELNANFRSEVSRGKIRK